MQSKAFQLKFTPLEFETSNHNLSVPSSSIIKIYSVGVWNSGAIVGLNEDFALKFTPLEFETIALVIQDMLCDLD